MKLATLRTNRPDGELVVVSRDLTRMARAADIAPTLQAALDDWTAARPRLEARFESLESGRERAEPFDQKAAHSPLPRAYQWCDGSVYPGHNERMAKWANKALDPRWYQEPWMYQGMSDGFLAPTDDMPAQSEDWGIDYEGEIAVVTGAVPYAASTETAAHAILLVMLANDVSLRLLMGPELSKGFGFVQSKPASAFSPVAVTPDELGAAWRQCRLHRPLVSHVNGEQHGDPDAGEMAHGFDRLIQHVAKTRTLVPGSIIGSGTVSSRDEARGTSCLAERRVIETLATGAAKTPWLKVGDRVRIEMFDEVGRSIFGAIDQRSQKRRNSRRRSRAPTEPPREHALRARTPPRCGTAPHGLIDCRRARPSCDTIRPALQAPRFPCRAAGCRRPWPMMRSSRTRPRCAGSSAK